MENESSPDIDQSVVLSGLQDDAQRLRQVERELRLELEQLRL